MFVSHYGPGGEFDSDWYGILCLPDITDQEGSLILTGKTVWPSTWAFLIFVNRKPPMPGPGPDAPPPPDSPAPLPDEHMHTRPAWRTTPRSTRRIRKSRPDQPPPPEPAPEPITWQREYRVLLHHLKG